MEWQKKLHRRLMAAAISICMLLPLAACTKAPAETTVPVEPVTADQAITHLQEQSESLGFDNALDGLEEKNTAQIGGDTYIRLQQHYEGFPVYGKTIVYAADEQGELTTVTGNVQDVDPNIDLMPSVTTDDVLTTVNQFFTDTLGEERINTVSSLELSGDDLCVFTEAADGNGHLAYRITVNGYELVIDAHSGELLFSNCLLRWATWQNLSGQQAFYENVLTLEDNGEYFLTDEGRKIASYGAKHTEMSKFWGVLDYNVNIDYDADMIRWSAGENPPADAVDAYVNTQIAYDYFDKVLGNTAPDGNGEGEILLLTGIEYVLDENGEISGQRMNNAKSETDFQHKATLLSFGVGTYGKPSGAAHVDWVAHEYMHSVEAYHSNMRYEGESGAIMEGLSDIFGELVESWFTKQAPDWVFNGTKRNMRNPNDGGYPVFVGDDDRSGEDYVHGYSTIISHSAYLMWNGIDGTESKKLSEQQLAELWYRAVLMMPSDCDFILCRQLVEVAAQSMENLTDEQRSCVREAFDRVGIAPSRGDDFHADYLLAEDATLSVYDQNNEPYSGYTIRISGSIDMKEIASNMTPDIGWVVNRTVTVEEAGAYALDLPQGSYTLTITDPHYDEAYTIYVAISDEYSESNIDLITAYEDPLVVVIPSSTEVITEFFYEADGTLSNITHHDYNEKGLLCSTTNWTLSDDDRYAYWYANGTTSYQYDSKGNSVQEIICRNNDDTITNYEYDDRGNLTLEHYLQSGIKREYRYDDNGNLIWSCGKDADGNTLDAVEYFYDANGNQIRSVDYWYSDNEIAYADVYISEYDDQGHLISTKSEEYDDDWTVYIYDPNWNLIKKESCYGDAVTSITYAYDEQNQLIYKEESDFWDGKTGTTYEYDSDGKLVTQTSYDGSKIVYVYDMVRSSEPVGGWKEAYRSFIRNLENIPEETCFYLSDMDGDGIPELYIDFVIYADGAVLCTYDGSGVITEQLSSGTVSFIPDTGFFHHYWSFQGMYSDTVYHVESGLIKEVCTGFWTDMEPDSHSWNDESVTPEIYTQNLTNAFDDSVAVPLGYLPVETTVDSTIGPNGYSFTQILAVLS